MNPVPADCKFLYQSLTQLHYFDKSKGHKRPEPILQETTDPVLINGQKENNLVINSKPIPYKVCHPYVKNEHEEYVEFIKRIPCMDKNVFCKHFINPEPQPDVLPGIFMENKTVYQKDYSPNIYTSKKDDIQMRRNSTPMEVKLEKTTYADSYNRLNEIKDIKKITKITPFCEETRKRILQDELRKVYKTGITIYYSEICQPALIRYAILQKKKLIRDGPLDQHTLRKL